MCHRPTHTRTFWPLSRLFHFLVVSTITAMVVGGCGDFLDLDFEPYQASAVEKLNCESDLTDMAVFWEPPYCVACPMSA